MDEKNQQALSLAFKRAKAKSLKIGELGLTPKFTAKATDALIEVLAKAKAKTDNSKWEEHVKGQRWYVEDLIAFSKLTPQERLDHEYAQAFPDVADEDEMLSALTDIVAA